MPTPLLQTKLYVPQPHPNLVPRPHLVGRLEEGLRLRRRLTLVSAPAGFGKTTLLSEWISQRQGDRGTGGQGDKETRRGGLKSPRPFFSPSPCLPLSAPPPLLRLAFARRERQRPGALSHLPGGCLADGRPRLGRTTQGIAAVAPDSEASSFAQEWGEIAQARVLIAQGLLSEATSLLDRLARSAEAGGRNGRLIEILVLQAIALQAQNKAVHALTVLEKALSLAGPEGYVQVFVDEGPPMAALLRQAISRSIVPDYTSRLLAAFGEESRGAAEGESISALIEPLSERERQVLWLLAGGLSNQEIAEALVVAVGTVKVHIHNIYGKLGTRSRTQAIARARELSLL